MAFGFFNLSVIHGMYSVEGYSEKRAYSEEDRSLIRQFLEREDFSEVRKTHNLIKGSGDIL